MSETADSVASSHDRHDKVTRPISQLNQKDPLLEAVVLLLAGSEFDADLTQRLIKQIGSEYEVDVSQWIASAAPLLAPPINLPPIKLEQMQSEALSPLSEIDGGVLAERERCAEIAKSLAHKPPIEVFSISEQAGIGIDMPTWVTACREIAAAIQRGE